MDINNLLNDVLKYFEDAMLTIPEDIAVSVEDLNIYSRGYHFGVLDVIFHIKELLFSEDVPFDE